MAEPPPHGTEPDSDPGLLHEWDRAHVWHPFTQAATAPQPPEIISARGAELLARDGKRYLDLVSSWWVTLHGHGHPAIAGAIANQARSLEQVIFADFTHAPAVRLAKALADRLPGDLGRVFYSDDGSTAVEVALKLAYQYWQNRGEDRRRRYIAFAGGYHGDTVGAMSVGESSGFFDPFRRLLFPVETLPYPTWSMAESEATVAAREDAALAALDRYLDSHGAETAAAIVEPLVQGAGGMQMSRPRFLKALAERLAQAGVLLIFDEVMTGFGRTGRLFACERAGVVPDLICLAKGLTGGFLPLSATVCRESLYQAFMGEDFSRAFAHGHSFSANPLGCAAALASLELFGTEDTLGSIRAIEAVHAERLARLIGHGRVARPRYWGSIAALDIAANGKTGEKSGYTAAVGGEIKAFFMERGFFIRPLGNVFYLLPPYCVTASDLHQAYDLLEAFLEDR